MTKLRNKFCATDTETTGLQVFKGARPFCYIVTYKETEYEIAPGPEDYVMRYDPHWNATEITDEVQLITLVTRNLETVRPILEDESIDKVMHNSIFDRLMYRSVNLKLKGQIHDTMIAKHLIDENTPKSLDYCSERYLKHLGLEKQEHLLDVWFKQQKIKKADRRYDQVPWDIMKVYAAYDSLCTYMLWELFREKLIPGATVHGQTFPPMESLYLQEMAFCDVLLRSHWRGYAVDVPFLQKKQKELDLELKVLADEVYEENFGRKFDILSGPQLAMILTEDFGVDLPKTKTGRMATSEDVLSTIDHPFAKKCIQYRKMSKRKSTYIDNILLDMTNGVVHPNINPTGTITGRVSSKYHTMPKPKDPAFLAVSEGISMEEAIQMAEDIKMVRKAFVNRPGHTVFPIDFEQQEYRMALAYFGEQEMIKKVNEENADYHKMIMEELGEYLKTRNMAKTYNFMVLYGGGIAKIAQKLKISEDEARNLKRAFFDKFQNAGTFMRNLEASVKLVGGFCNLFGRRKRFPDLGKTYQALNHLIQGVCADYTKMKMIEVDNYVKPYGGFVLLQIHDELHVEVPNDKFWLIPEVCRIMSDSLDILPIRLDVDPNIIRTNWADKESFDLTTVQQRGGACVY